MIIYLTTIFAVSLSTKFCNIFFPKKMNELYLKIGLFMFNIYIKIYTCLHKIYTCLHKIYIRIRSFTHNYENKIIYINNGCVIRENVLGNYTINNDTINNDTYDLILYNEPINNEPIKNDSINNEPINNDSINNEPIKNDSINSQTKYNVVRLDSKSIIPNNYNIKYSKSSVHFLNIKISYDGNIYNIDLGENNFYIIGNILFDKPFIKWILRKDHNVILDDSKGYICNIMDNNVNFIVLKSTNGIVIEKDKYILY